MGEADNGKIKTQVVKFKNYSITRIVTVFLLNSKSKILTMVRSNPIWQYLSHTKLEKKLDEVLSIRFHHVFYRREHSGNVGKSKEKAGLLQFNLKDTTICQNRFKYCYWSTKLWKKIKEANTTEKTQIEDNLFTKCLNYSRKPRW